MSKSTKYRLAEHDAMDEALAVPKTKKGPELCASCSTVIVRNSIPTTVVVRGVEHGPFCAPCMGYRPTRYVQLTEAEFEGMKSTMPMTTKELQRRMALQRSGWVLLSPGVVRWFDLDETEETQAAAMEDMRRAWRMGQPWPYQKFLHAKGVVV